MHSTYVRTLLGALALGAASLASADALADSPPMPPCPPGWKQVGNERCVKPFECPEGWTLAAGPTCEPWVCKEAKDCNWKGFQPCVAAEVCVDGSGKAVRVCEGGKCPSGTTCKPSKLCANGGLKEPKFTNWSGPPASATGATATPAATSASADPSSAPSSAAPASSGTTSAPAPKKGGCSSCDASGGDTSSMLGGAALVLGAIAAAFVARRRA